MNTLDEKVLVEAGQIVSQRETPRDRAVRLLRELVPAFPSRDKAMDHLYYVTPSATPDLRLFSIAAALYILGDADPVERSAVAELIVALKEAENSLRLAAEILRERASPRQANQIHAAALKVAEVLSRHG